MIERIAIKIKKIEKLLEQPLQEDTRRIWLGHLQSLHNMLDEQETERARKRIEALARLGGAFIEQ